MSLAGGRKYVILDEADYLNADTVQPALRNFMEEYSANCGFILTCNFVNKIIAPLHSRCSVVEFKMTPEDKPKLASELFKRACIILDNEQVEYDKKVVAEVVKRHFPDNRRVLNELQRYAGTGKIDAGILVNFADLNMKDLMKSMKEKEFSKVRKWVAQNIDGDTSQVFRTIYDTVGEYVEPNSVPQVVVTLADYQYKAAFAADAEINMMAMLTEMMIDCEWK